MVRALQKHLLIVLVALVLSLAAGLPALVAEHRMGASFQGVPVLVSEDELYYLARAHETLDGHERLGNPYLLEHKDTPGLQFWVSDMLFAHVSTLFGGLTTTGLVADFLFPFLIVLVSYAIIYALTHDRLWSVAATTFIVPGMVFYELLRTPHPQLFILVLTALLLLIYALEKKGRWYALGALLFGASLFYVYPFYWTYFMATVGIALVACFLLLRQEKAHLTILSVFLGSLVLGIPYFLEMLSASQIPHYLDSLRRIGVVETHFPSGLYIVSIVAVTLLVFAWCWWKRLVPRTAPMLLIASSALAGAVATNQHIVTGMNFFFTGHYELPTEFMCVFTLAACLPGLMKQFTPARGLVITTIFLFALSSLVPVVLQHSEPKESDIADQRYGPVLAWLDENTEKDSVVYTNQRLSLYIPSYTHNNVLFAPYAQQAYLSQEEVDARFLASRYFDPITRETILASEFDVFGAEYVGRAQHADTTNRFRRLVGIPLVEVERYPEEDIQRLVGEGKRMHEGSFDEATERFQVDYLVWDTVKNPDWELPKSLRPVHEQEGFVVYAVPD